MNPVAVVTGGTRGIGLGIARHLAADGWTLVLCGRRPAARVCPDLDRIPVLAGRYRYLPADVAAAQQRLRVVDAAREAGPIRLLVNNAGISPAQRCDLLDATEDSFERVLATNLRGPYFLTQAVVRHMLAAGPPPAGAVPPGAATTGAGARPATIVFVSSVSATLASPERGEYCVSKAGLAMAVQLWAVRLAGTGIGVFEVRPGVIRTDMTAAVAARYDRLIGDGLVPQGRWGAPGDVGRAVAMLARGELGYSTGQVIAVDGGMTLGRL